MADGQNALVVVQPCRCGFDAAFHPDCFLAGGNRAAFQVAAANRTLGAFTGLPSAQVNRTIDGIEAVIEGEVTGVGAVVAPITGVQR